MNRFEQLIEYVINDEEQKAQELFHDIIVEKSRQIYENMMAEEQEEEEIEEGMMDEVEMEEESDMNMEAEGDDDGDEMGGDAADEFINDVKADKGDDMGDDDMGGDEPATKEDIMNVEDKLDQLMAEFEDMMGGMGGDNGDGFGSQDGGDAIEMDDTGDMQPGMMEAVTLKAAPKPVTSEEGSVNKRSTVAANAGAKGPIGNSVKPVHAGGEMGGNHDTPAYRNTTKDMIGRVGNTPAQGTQNLKPANKPHLGQASNVNTKSPVARG
jgi:hypothetical protein